jgi:hypothetical protein
MRLPAYKQALIQAEELGHGIRELKGFFSDTYSPAREACRYILEKARKDDQLTHSEFVELYLAYSKNELKKI